MDFVLTEEIVELAAAARAVAADVLRPNAREAEVTRGWSDAAVRHVGELGIQTLALPPPLGEGNALAGVVALEALAWGDAGGLAGADRLGAAAGALAVLAECHDRETAARLVTACGDGEAVLALAVADSAEGVSGVWAPGENRPVALYVATPESLTLFDESDLHAETTDIGALHASGGVWITLGADARGRSVALSATDALRARSGARLWAGAVLCGIAQAALDYAVEYGSERVVFGRPVVGHQANAFEIAAASAGLDAARSGIQSAAALVDAAEATSGAWLSTVGYLEARDSALGATDLAVQLLGGHGYVTDHPVEKWFREARVVAQLWGGEDAAVADLTAHVLNVPDPLVV